MHGIVKLKEVGTDVAKFAMKIEEALEDKKLSFTEAIGLGLFAVPKAMNHVNDAEEIAQEMKDLDDNEAKELSEHIADKLDLQTDEVEGIVEAGFDWLVGTKKLVTKVRIALKKEAA